MQGRQMNNPHLPAFLKSIYQIKAFALSNPTLHQAANFNSLLLVIRSGKPLLISLSYLNQSTAIIFFFS
jgi:hypothetical protein